MDPTMQDTPWAWRQRGGHQQPVSARVRDLKNRPATKTRLRNGLQVLRTVDGRSRLATAQGLYLLLTGVWPLIHYRSFEWVSGPKEDDWLVRCVGGLAATMGYVQLRCGVGEEGRAVARRIGMGAAATFGAIDVVYGGGGRISRIYLLDAAVEVAWLTAWMATGRNPQATTEHRSPTAEEVV